MPYRSMSLEEFAKHVCMDARELRKMAEDGELPAHKVAGKWRFHRAHVTEWLQQRMPTLDEAHLMALEKSLGSSGDRRAAEENAIVTDLIGLDGVDDCLPARTRDSVLRELVKLVQRTGLLDDESSLLEALEQREALCPTALPHGVGIPHPRQPMPYATAEPLICVGRVPAGIAFGAPNHSLTKLFFLICCHDDREHLHVLARLMRILDDAIVQNLLAAESSSELLETLIVREEAVIKQLAAR